MNVFYPIIQTINVLKIPAHPGRCYWETAASWVCTVCHKLFSLAIELGFLPVFCPLFLILTILFPRYCGGLSEALPSMTDVICSSSQQAGRLLGVVSRRICPMFFLGSGYADCLKFPRVSYSWCFLQVTRNLSAVKGTTEAVKSKPEVKDCVKNTNLTHSSAEGGDIATY